MKRQRIENREQRRERAQVPGLRAQAGGFTIVELMIATGVFSVILMLCATGIIQVGRMFYKGTITDRTQDTARLVVDDISQSIQFGVSATNFWQTSSMSYAYDNDSVLVKSLCLGSVRYSYTTDRSLGSNTATQSPHVLWKDRIASNSACTPLDITKSSPPNSSSDGIEMLGDNMRLTSNFSVPYTTSTGLWNITVTVSYGDNDVFIDGSNYTQCIGSNNGGQFCASSTINTQVVKRL